MYRRMGPIAGASRFDEQYRCYGMRKARISAERQQLVNYVLLPPSALARLAALHIEYPMLFELTAATDEPADELAVANVSAAGTSSPATAAKTHAGVLEFIAEEGRVYVPEWMLKQLRIGDGEIIRVTNSTLPLGRFLKIQPQSTDFLDIHDPKAVLENALRQYSALTQGDIISIGYNGKEYGLLCMEVKPNGAGISIVETDLEVDFAPPVGYEEPKAQPTRKRLDSYSTGVASSASLSIDEHKVAEDAGKKWTSFSGQGARLSGRPLGLASPLNNGVDASSTTSTSTAATTATAHDAIPVAIRLPHNKLWFGYEVKAYDASAAVTSADTPSDAPPSGPGRTLRADAAHVPIMRLGPDDAGDGGSVGNKQKGTRRPYRHRLHRSTSTARPIMSPRTEAEGQRVAVARDKRSKHLRDIARQLVAGGVAGAASRTVVSPMERTKILFQVQGVGAAKYNGVVASLIKIYREEGIMGYFKGNGTNCIRIIPYSAVQFASYEQLKRLLLADGHTELDTVSRLTCGALAGIASVITTYPLDIARTRLSVLLTTTEDTRTRSGGKMSERQPASHTGRRQLKPTLVNVVLDIYRHEHGVFGLYRGLVPTLLGVAPYVALNFTCYETLRAYFTPAATMDNPRPQPTVIWKLFCGGLAGAIAQTCTYPLDLVRRRFQVMGMRDVASGAPASPTATSGAAAAGITAGIKGSSDYGFRYGSTWDALKTIIRTEGVRGLYKGCLPNYLKVAPAISVSFVVYEQVKQLLHD